MTARELAAEEVTAWVERTRAAQSLSRKIEDPATLAALASMVAGPPAEGGGDRAA